MTNKLPKNKGGRPRIDINWQSVEACCNLMCTGEEIAAIHKISYDTLERAIKRKYKISFAEYFNQKSAGGKMSLRRRQYEAAKEGNSAMLIWLGKQWLNQKDKSEVDQNTTIEPVQIVLPDNSRSKEKE